MRSLLRVGAALLGLTAAVVAVHRIGLSPREILSLVRAWAAAAGPAGPVVFALLQAASTVLFVPSGLFTAAAPVLFGPVAGFLSAWGGAWLGGVGAYAVARWLGRDAVARLVGGRLARFDEAAERHGFRTVFLLRAACLPFTPLSFALGLTRIRFGDYFWGTGLGLSLGTLLFTTGVALVADAAAGRPVSLARGLRFAALVAVTVLVAVRARRRTAGDTASG